MRSLTRFILTILCFSAISSAQINPVQLEPALIFNSDRSTYFSRTIYSLGSQFSSTDSIFALQKIQKFNITKVDSINSHELQIDFVIEPGFTEFGRHKFVVLDSLQKKKLDFTLDVRYANSPFVESILIRQNKKVMNDTIRLSDTDYTLATLTIRGTGLFDNTMIEFDDPAIQVSNTPGWRRSIAPNLLQVGLEIKTSNINVGYKQFRIKNDFAMEGFGKIFIKSNRSPIIYGSVPDIIADGQDHRIQIRGDYFQSGLTALLLPQDGIARVQNRSTNEVDLLVNIPVLENTKSYKLVIQNPDGLSDTTGYFTAKTPPLNKAYARSLNDQPVFLDKETRIVFTVQTYANKRLNKQTAYEINIDGEKFTVNSVINDSTCEAVIKLSQKSPYTLLNQHVFTISPVNAAPRWKGLLFSKPAPELTYMSPENVLHPQDTLSFVFKGKNLDDIIMFITDPEITFKIQENRGDLIRVTAIAGRHLKNGTYPVKIRKNDVTFEFPEHQINIQQWQPFTEYASIYTTSLNSLPPDSLWKEKQKARIIEKTDKLRMDFYLQNLSKDAGTQKVFINAVLIDSSNAVRAETRFYKALTYENKTFSWNWRLHEKIKSGDRIEISINNTGGQNKKTEVFFVKPHWSESFKGSTSFIIFKAPMNGGNATAEILRTVAIGLSYQPFENKDFLEFDSSVLIGNATSSDSDLDVDLGLGLSVILWNHIQIGMGSNLTNGPFSEMFAFMGTRIKIPVPW